MPNNLKALIVVLAIAAMIFYLAKPIALQFMSAASFSRRRLVWFVLTIVGFVSPNFWIYTAVAIPTFIWAGRKDSNPIALYLLTLHVIPPVDVIIPILGNNGLFALNNYRLLALFVLVPAVIRWRKDPNETATNPFGAIDVLLLVFGLLQVALYSPPDLPFHYVIPDSPSNAMRRGVLFLLDVYLLYFSISRLCKKREKMVEAIAAFCVGCGVMAAIAMFERLKGWLLYVDIAGRWGTNPNAQFYLMRGGAVRAQVAAGHSIALGCLLAVAFGFWLYMSSHVQSRSRRVGAAALLWGGLVATFSRGGWLGAAAIYFTFSALGPRAASRFIRASAIAAALGCLVLMSPIGDSILEMLPQFGKPADEYRHRLAERGWELVMAHPFFGDQFPWPEMEDLRQGEGIIDIVNTYLGVGLDYGLIGLLCFLSVMLIGFVRVYARTRSEALRDPDLALCGTSLIACIVGMLIMIDSSSFNMGVSIAFYVLVGLAAAYSQSISEPKLRTAIRRAKRPWERI